MTMGDWRNSAACLGMDVNLFFPGRFDSAKPAKGVCARCTVTRQCLTDSLRWGTYQHGVRGGLTATERVYLVKAGREAT